MKFNRPVILVVIFLLSIGKGLSQTSKPNVIIINVDDLGYGDIGIQGATHVKTPTIDRLASEGKRFTDFHSASAVCSPSRYALLTGQYPSAVDFWRPIFLKKSLQIDTSRTTIADVMKSAGYATAVIGKWHLGFQNHSPVDWNAPLSPGPLELGFDYYFGVPVLNSHPPFVYVENHKVVGWVEDDPFVYGKRAQTRYFDEKFDLREIGGAKAAHQNYEDRQVATTLTERAQEWIKTNKNEPFFLYFATTNIHHPFTPHPRFIGTSTAGPYGDAIHELDWMVSQLLNTLEQEGLTDDTLIIFTSDNGGMLNRGGQTAREAGHLANASYLGWKFDAWEGGHRVPFIARWPGIIEANSVSDQLFGNVDLLATMADLVGYNLNSSEGPNSVSMLDALVSNPSDPIREELLISPVKPKNISLRKGKWMYISDQGGGGFSGNSLGDHSFGGAAAFTFTKEVNSDIEDGKIKKNAPSAQLYDLEADPHQSTNVYQLHPEIVESMEKRINELTYQSAKDNNERN